MRDGGRGRNPVTVTGLLRNRRSHREPVFAPQSQENRTQLPQVLLDVLLLSSSEPNGGGGEAERERDWRFHAAKLCGTRTDEPTCRHVGAIRHLRCNDSLGVDELESQYRTAQQQAPDQSDERGLQIAHGLRCSVLRLIPIGPVGEASYAPHAAARDHEAAGNVLHPLGDSVPAHTLEFDCNRCHRSHARVSVSRVERLGNPNLRCCSNSSCRPSICE